jgi:predicted enzyme related to lactoylglutathione lyase
MTSWRFIGRDATVGAMGEAATSGDWVRPVVHFEIEARDPDTLVPFYEALFHWKVGEGPIRVFEAGLGGPEPGPAGHFRQSHRSGVTLYVQVRDLAESIELATGLGATLTLEPFAIPHGPTIAGITDPEGNPLTLVQQ